MRAIGLNHVLCRLPNVEAVDLSRVAIGFEVQLEFTLPAAEVSNIKVSVFRLLKLSSD